jgi:hypothetical protein
MATLPRSPSTPTIVCFADSSSAALAIIAIGHSVAAAYRKKNLGADLWSVHADPFHIGDMAGARWIFAEFVCSTLETDKPSAYVANARRRRIGENNNRQSKGRHETKSKKFLHAFLPGSASKP